MGGIILSLSEVIKAFMKMHLCKYFKGTVLKHVWLPVLISAAYTAVIVSIHNTVESVNLNFPKTLIPVLGTVTGLLLVFRTNTAYDRYWEGRKLWSSILHDVRTLTRYVWAVVEDSHNEEIIMKITAINLLVAFPFAAKNYLRGDYSCSDPTLRKLIGYLPRCRESPYRRNGISPKVIISVIEDLKAEANQDGADQSQKVNIPVEIMVYFASYLSHLAKKENPVSQTFLNAMNSCKLINWKAVDNEDLYSTATSVIALSSLSKEFAGLERVLKTPIPRAYAVHLEHTAWMFLLTLPFQLVGMFNWTAVPAVALVTFALLGILEIGGEIENPFGEDDNDLPLDEYCDEIHREVYMTVGTMMPPAKSWMLSRDNLPFTPTSPGSCEELLGKSVDDLRYLMTKRAESNSRMGSVSSIVTR